MGKSKINEVEALLRSRQLSICDALTAIDTESFQTDTWDRPGGGGGITKVISGSVFEKAGVNTSNVYGVVSEKETPLFEQLLHKAGIDLKLTPDTQFKATGISLVIHPKNPFVPTVHANYRYFEMDNQHGQCWWFGGGADLTPYYLIDEDAIHFHQVLKDVCEAYQPGMYPIFKEECDRYFYIPHRNETRGIGGIFFDYLNHDYDALFEFISTASERFVDAYIPIVEKRKNTPFTDQHKAWQAIRRGRYAEFNLVYDRGTLFGLKTGGRIESILMSMPPMAEWRYDYMPENGSEEANIQAILKQPKDWV